MGVMVPPISRFGRPASWLHAYVSAPSSGSLDPALLKVTESPSSTVSTWPAGQLSAAIGGSLVNTMLTVLPIVPAREPSETVRRKSNVVVPGRFGAKKDFTAPFGVTFVRVTVGEAGVSCVQA